MADDRHAKTTKRSQMTDTLTPPRPPSDWITRAYALFESRPDPTKRADLTPFKYQVAFEDGKRASALEEGKISSSHSRFNHPYALLLRSAYEATKAVDLFDLHSENPASVVRWNELLEAQRQANEALADHITKT